MSALRFTRSLGFPFVAPSWPGGVERPIAKSELGTNYNTDWARKVPARYSRALILEGITRPAIKLLADPTVYGLDRVEQLDGPVIFAANHSSHVDTSLLLTTLPSRVRHNTIVGAAADHFFDRKWKAGMWAFLLNAIPIERTKANRASAERAAALINNGWNLIIFPEGGRSPDGYLSEFKGGAAYLSQRCGVPIVPVHIEGTRLIMPKGGRVKPGRSRVTFGHPITPGEKEDARKLAARLEQAVMELGDEATTDWWSARKRAASGTTPDLRAPKDDIASWRKTWVLPESKRKAARLVTGATLAAAKSTAKKRWQGR